MIQGLGLYPLVPFLHSIYILPLGWPSFFPAFITIFSKHRLRPVQKFDTPCHPLVNHHSIMFPAIKTKGVWVCIYSCMEFPHWYMGLSGLYGFWATDPKWDAHRIQRASPSFRPSADEPRCHPSVVALGPAAANTRSLPSSCFGSPDAQHRRILGCASQWGSVVHNPYNVTGLLPRTMNSIYTTKKKKQGVSPGVVSSKNLFFFGMWRFFVFTTSFVSNKPKW